MFKLMQHLLPNGRAWRTTKTTKNLSKLQAGMTEWGGDVRSALDTCYDELRPFQTGALSEWEDQFGIMSSLTDEQARRVRLDAAWRATGGQDPRYIEDTLRGAGFDIHVYDWWKSRPPLGSHACASPRDPREWLEDIEIACGIAEAECGEVDAECGNYVGRVGYPLVNIIESSVKVGDRYEQVRKIYTTPSDPALWPYFWYVGGPTFGSQAIIPLARKLEFETLCLKIGPLQLWIGVLVKFV